MGQSKNLAIVRAVIDQHLSTAQAAARFGVSRQWVNSLLRRYRESGPAALAPGSRAPHSPAVRTPKAVTERIIALRRSLGAQGADNGAETIAWHLEQEGSPVPSRSTIHRILRTAGLVTDQPAKRPRSSYHRFEADTPNETWQADITHWFLTNGTRVEILDFLDDHSRYLLLLKAQTAFTGGDVVACTQALISTFGPPASTLTDNGLVFTSRLTGHPGARNGFEVLLATHRIQQKNGSPHHPQTQGKIERFHQTLKRWLGHRPKPGTLRELQAMLDTFQDWYNTARPHRAIGRRTPEQAYTALPKATPAATTDPEYRTRTDRVEPPQV